MATTEEPRKTFVQKPEKPDQAEYEKNLQNANDEHAAVREKLNDVKQKLEFIKSPGKSPRQQELRDQLNELRAAQQAKKGGRAQIDEQIKTLDTSIKARIREQNASMQKMPYRTLDELEDAIKRLSASVDSGKMMIVDERKALAEISSLNKVKKNFGAFSEVQKTIDADKAKLDELRQQRKDPEVQELSDKFEAVKKELDDLKLEQDAAFADLNQLRDERTRLQEEQEEKWQAIQTLKDEYFSAKNAYRAYEQEAWKIKREKWAKQEREAKIAYRRQIAQEKMEQASEKAYTSEIITCESLIGFFDPSSAEAARKAKLESGPRALAALPTRSVDASAITGKKLAKKEDRDDDYFIGDNSGKKKGKKGRKDAGAAVTSPGAESPAAESPAAKFNLNVGVLAELAKVDVEVPMGKDDVSKTLEKLREKLAWYKESQETKTKENIAKAQKEIDRLEAEAAKEDGEGASGSSAPKKVDVEVREEKAESAEEEKAE
ncbi:hypothetical protein DFP73DRAFT_503393 [Morchella snyderi]|nr:hypothetical protein DFP73DRAFT_503393 [Morchella snyderi]